MPSLRKRVSSYFRQLSFHNEPREKKNNINENTFVTKYLQGHITLREGPPIIYGKNPTDLPNYELGKYDSGPNTIIGCYSGPNGGLTTVKRIEKHLSVLDDDIDYIDTHDEELSMILPTPTPKKSPQRITGQPIDNTTMVIKVAGNEYCVTNRPKRHSKSHSLGSISAFKIEIEKTKIEKCSISSVDCDLECQNVNTTIEDMPKTVNNAVDRDTPQKESQAKKPGDNQGINKTSTTNTRDSDSYNNNQHKPTHINNKSHRSNPNDPKSQKTVLRNPQINKVDPKHRKSDITDRKSQSYALSKSKSDGNAFHHKKRGKIIKIDRPRGDEQNHSSATPSITINDSLLPNEWNKKSDHFYGLSDSLYDRNQVTKSKNGDPIADCFGIIARNDSAILAVADGVNWGEKASIAAKSAVHGCLHYLNKTIFNDTKPFQNLTIKTDETSNTSNLNPDKNLNLISNTREVFVCLLRAFNCAHDLILENKGMLTTLTVAVVLPLKQKLVRSDSIQETQYVCCVCNVGDTLAYIYSQKYGVREVTKGSHDVTSNRDMRDALGALGPVDGINPELSNLTLSITTLQKGDIVVVASDGLTDNFDPNVCRFTINSNIAPAKPKRPSNAQPQKSTTSNLEEQKSHTQKHTASRHHEVANKPPIKPPRRSKHREDSSRSSAERSSIRSASISQKSSSPSIENDRPEKQQDSKKVTAPLETDLDSVEYGNPLVAQFMRENSLEEPAKSRSTEPRRPAEVLRANSVEEASKTKSIDHRKSAVIENKASSLRRQVSTQRHEPSQHKMNPPSSKTIASSKDNYKFLKSRTSIDLRSTNSKQILRNEDGIPYVTPIQRYELQLLLIEDILKNGISGRDTQCTKARNLCEDLVSFTISITSAKRHTLEDQDLYFDNQNGVLVEVSAQEKKSRRKKGLERVQNLPGKLDHVSVVAYNVGNFAY